MNNLEMENLRKKLKTGQETPNPTNQSTTSANTVDELESSSLLDDRHETNSVDEHHNDHDILEVERFENSSSSLQLQYEELIRKRDNKLDELKLFNDSYNRELLLRKNSIRKLTFESEKLKKEMLLQTGQNDDEIIIDDSTLQFDNSNENEFNEDCLLEIFSYLSIDDMMQVKRVCKKWYQVSQQWFKKIKTLSYTEYYPKTGRLELPEIDFMRNIYEKSEKHGLNDFISILHSCGHHIKYFKVFMPRMNMGRIETQPSADECDKFIFEWVPKLCKNIVEFEIYGEKWIYKPSTFETMSTHWKKLRKINIKRLRQPVKKYFYDLLCNNQQLTSLTVWFDRDARCRLNEKLFTCLSTTIEEIELGYVYISDCTKMSELISASENFISLRSVKFSHIYYLTDAVISAIANITSLTHLTLSDFDQFETRKTINPIANLKDLKSLDLSLGPRPEKNFNLDEDSFIYIVTNCIQLEQLDIRNGKWLTDKGMAAIAKLKKLKCLYIDTINVSNESIINLCDSLEVLWCVKSNMNNNDAIKLLKKGTNLRFLSFGRNGLTKNILQAACGIANERKNNILCISGYVDSGFVENIDTPYFKYAINNFILPLKIFPSDIWNYIEERLE